MPPHTLGDHPVIRNMERTGFPDGKCEEWPVCPACGGETIYSTLTWMVT